MKAYGVPRLLYLDYFDIQDCHERGAKSSKMKLSSKSRQTSRRNFKKRERSKVRSEISKTFIF